MKKNIFSIILASLALVFAASSCEKVQETILNTERTTDTDISAYLPEIVSGDLKLGTYNLWISTKGEGSWAWAERKTKLAQSIVDNNFDVFGFQEADKTVRDELPNLVKTAGKNYEWWFVCRDNQAATSGEALGIAYDPARFTLTDKHYFWLSETPDVMSKGWDETGYHRMACCAVVTEIATEKKFFLMVTHMPLADNARKAAANLIIAREGMYNTAKLPSFLVGDMNAAPDDPASTTFAGYWKDSYATVRAVAKTGTIGTFNGHNTAKDMSQAAARIDYIYWLNSASVLTYKVDDKVYGSIYPSDHFPVSVTFNLPDPTPISGGIEGEGTAEKPWKIASVDDWNTVAASINGAGAYTASAHYVLTADLDFAGKTYSNLDSFEGVLDGANHSMTGISGAAPGENFGGVINNLKGVVKDLYVEADLSSAYKNLAGVVGFGEPGSIIDGVTFKGNLTGTAACSRIGGIVGTGQGVVVNCGCLGGSFLAGEATKSENMGGVAGRMEMLSGLLLNSYSFVGEIVSSQNNFGGLSGGNGSGAYTANCYATCTSLSSTASTGGDSFSGCIGYSKEGNIRNVFTPSEAPKKGASSEATPWVGNDKLASHWTPSYGAALTLAGMKSGAVKLPSSGTEYASFVEALNAGIADYEALPSVDAKPEKGVFSVVNKPSVVLRKWTSDPVTGYPIVSSDAGPVGPGSNTVVEIVFADYGVEKGWTNGVDVPSFVEGGITFSASDNGGSKNGVYYATATDPGDWRFYQARGGGMTISVGSGHSFVKATFTYNNKNNGVLLDSAKNIVASGKEITLSGSTATFTVGSTTEGTTNAQARIQKVKIEYK